MSRPWLAVAAAIWAVCVSLPVGPPPRLGDWAYSGPVTLLGEVTEGRHGSWALGATVDDEVLLLDFATATQAGRGDVLMITGHVGGEPGSAGGRRHGGVLRIRSILAVEESAFLPHRAGKAVTDVVERRLQPFDEGRALLAGFLIGDTSRMTDADTDAMRRSGLAHYVAVSGSNVALFLGLLAVVAGPLALGPRRRAAVGLLALPVYVAATRFEPSVMRAATMAGIALGGRLLGVVLEAWQLLAVAVSALLLLDPQLTTNVGFQLSVAATAGVLAGARWPLRVRYMRPLAVTLGAQFAVAPLLLAHFGTVPLLSPLVNLVAAPLVAVSTVTGAIGVAVFPPLVAPASWLAGAVLTLARGAAPWPQLGVGEVALILLCVLAGLRLPRSRPLAFGALGVAVMAATVFPGSALGESQVVVLDVGQGDAILIHGGEGRFALVDGGPDPALAVAKLRDYRVEQLELMVLTHVHADHATGLTGVVETVPVNEVWMDVAPHTSAASEELLGALEERGIPVNRPAPGTTRRLGRLQLTVEAPLRRYASPNDQSIVITVAGPARSMLLSGDIETHAQADLDLLRADVLKVPHQGAGTSDPRWLEGVGSEVAVISVGPNQFGHPVEWVIDTLDDTNLVLRTDHMGDVVVDLAGPSPLGG